MDRRGFMWRAAGGMLTGMGATFSGCSPKQEYDLLIKGGTVFDGLGNPGVEADVAMAGGRIVLIDGDIDPRKAADVLDARGLAVSPGFIDVHTHTDFQIIMNPTGDSKLRQGITTEVGGHCGYSLFPLSDTAFEEYRDDFARKYGFDLTWRDLQGFYDRLGERGTAMNYATLVGHGALRDAVMGPYDRPPTDEEMERMKQILARYMDEGAWGLSTGLEYTPGSFAATDELIALCSVVSGRKGIYNTHMRSEQDQVLEALDEAVRTSRESGVNIEISHFKANYKQNWDKLDTMFEIIETARDEGIPIMADRYTYHASSTSLGSLYPLWVREGTTDDFVKRLSDPTLREKLKAHMRMMEAKLETWDNVLISSVMSDANRELEGLSVLAAARRADMQCDEFVRELLVEERGQVNMVKFGMSEENLKRVLAHPMITVGSDGNAVSADGPLSQGKPHPRFYGTFPRFLGRFVREEGVVSLEEGIRKITSMSADKFGFTGRGRLVNGAFADAVVFDPDTVIDRATFTEPHRYPDGIPHVVVNGVVAIRDGQPTGALPGMLLKKTT